MGKIHYGGVIAGDEEIEAVNRVLRGQEWACGKETELLEEEAAAQEGRKYCLAVNSGSSGLLLAMSCVPKNSGIAMPAVQFPTAWSSAEWCRLKSFFVDSDDSFNMDPHNLENLMYQRGLIDAVCFVNIAGNPTNVREVEDICKRKKKLLIVDNCEGFGGEVSGRSVSTFGDINVTSTHAAHQIATGEGGLVFTDDYNLYMKMKKVRNWGRSLGDGDLPGYYPGYSISVAGLNLKPSDINSAIGRVQLKKLSKFSVRRRTNYNFLRENLQFPGLIHPRVDIENCRPSWYTCAFLTKQRDLLQKKLEDNGVETRPILCGNITRQPCLTHLMHPEFRMADRVFNEGLWFSVHPRYTPQDLQRAVDAILQASSIPT